MTLMLARIRDAHEAATAARLGVDAVEFAVDAAKPDLAAVQAIRAAAPGIILRLRSGGPLLAAALAASADEIALAPDPAGRETPPPNLAIVAITATVPADDDVRGLAGRFRAVMLDVGDHRLIDAVGIARLDAFASTCRAAGLRFGFAGRLEAPDVARLLLLRPDVLGFDRALRQGHHAEGTLDPRALEAIRALIPRELANEPASSRGRCVTDRIFVRDFVLSLAIGAYQAEHGVRQRVRFGVEAEVVREPAAPRDMRDVFSYDVIIETIRVLSERAHVTFVETLAEEIAASLLAHDELRAITVTVEKLDVIDGAVGIAITRERAR